MSSDLPLVCVFNIKEEHRWKWLPLVATLVVMGVELLKFIVMLFLQLYFACLGKASKRYRGMWRESNYQIVTATQPCKCCFFNVLFAKIDIYFYNISWWHYCQTSQPLAPTTTFNYTNEGKESEKMTDIYFSPKVSRATCCGSFTHMYSPKILATSFKGSNSPFSSSTDPFIVGKSEVE